MLGKSLSLWNNLKNLKASPSSTNLTSLPLMKSKVSLCKHHQYVTHSRYRGKAYCWVYSWVALYYSRRGENVLHGKQAICNLSPNRYWLGKPLQWWGYFCSKPRCWSRGWWGSDDHRVWWGGGAELPLPAERHRPDSYRQGLHSAHCAAQLSWDFLWLLIYVLRHTI